ncbi:MAG TPA: hypothetical protein VHK24_00900, partial [Steroidobacter sp.]|nr:hypothetical protein [Steroidobacter sp.]
MSSLRILRFASLEQLEALAPQWTALYERCPATTPFQAPAWLLGWWRAFAPGELRVFAAYERRRLVALAPFYLDARRLLPLGVGLSDFIDVLVDPA